MPRKGTKDNPIVVNIDQLSKAAQKLMQAEKKSDRSINILEAAIKDDFCHYKYEVATGKDIGFEHAVKGKGIISDDMRKAFNKLHVHLAVVDDVYKHSNIEIESISTMDTDELAQLYVVSGFIIKGGEENESIIMIGNKWLTAGSRMDLKTPKIQIDSLSSYKWYNELKEAADKCREEVALYHYGKYTPVQKDEDDEEHEKQGNLFEKKKEGEKEEPTTEETVDDVFVNAKV